MSDSMARIKGAGPKKRLSKEIARLTREQKSGKGPHFGKYGPKVPSGRPDILAAIAASKVRRGKA